MFTFVRCQRNALQTGQNPKEKRKISKKHSQKAEKQVKLY